MRWVVLVISVAWVATGCVESGEPVLVVVTDSGGVTVVTNGVRALEAAAEWSVSGEPVMSVGAGADPEISLFRVVDVVPLPNGRVAIGGTAPPQVVVANADGTPSAVLGAPGEGPGEFAGVSSLVFLPPDSIAVWDAERRRVSVFTEDGRLQREVSLAELAPLSWIASPNALESSARTYLRALSDDRWALFSVGVFGPGDAVRRVAAPSYAVSSEGAAPVEIGRFPGEATYSSAQTGVAPYPLGADTHFAVSGRGFVVGTSAAAEYRRYSDRGALEMIVRWPESDTLVEGSRHAAWERFRDEWLAEMPPAEASSIRDILDAMPRPARFPAYTGLVSSDSGDVWIGQYHPGQLELGAAYMGRMRLPERDWLVFDDDGSLKAKLRTPIGFRPFAVQNGLIWGVSSDELDIESVVAYDVVRGG